MWLYREVQLALFQFRAERLSELDSDSRMRLIKRVRFREQWLVLRRALDSSSLSTEIKVETCCNLVELDQQSFLIFMRAEYLPRLMIVAQGDSQCDAVDLALRLAARDQDVLLEVVKSLERLSDPGLTKRVLRGLDGVITASKGTSGLLAMLPSKIDRAILVSQIASKMGDPSDEVRLAAVQVLRGVLSQDIALAEGVFMTLLRDSRRVVKELVADLVLDFKPQLPNAICSAWLVRIDLSPELRSRF
jgi:hypothetical protein